MISVNTCFKHNFPENLPSQYQIYYHWLAPGRCWGIANEPCSRNLGDTYACEEPTPYCKIEDDLAKFVN